MHTALGPDHYLPFAAMARAGRWSLAKTVVVTVLCGLGHVASSLLLGLVGIAFGLALFEIEGIEELRGGLAAWLMLSFGLVYFAWGVRRAVRGRPHSHAHVHGDGTVHAHAHAHVTEHLHPHGAEQASLTPWILFTVFFFGPCEPLIPLLLYPAASASAIGIAVVTAAFAAATLVAMIVLVLVTLALGRRLAFARLARYDHALAGLVVLACGVSMRLGW